MQKRDSSAVPDFNAALSATTAAMIDAVNVTPNGGYLTRSQVAKRLGITASAVIAREKKGELKPSYTNAAGWKLYTEADIKDAPKRGLISKEKPPRGGETSRLEDPTAYTSEQAIAVFNVLDKGGSLIGAVKETGVHPALVLLIAEMHAKLSGGLFIRAEVMKKIEELPLEGTFPLKNDAELLEVLKTASEETCIICAKRPKSHCKVCAQQLRR